MVFPFDAEVKKGTSAKKKQCTYSPDAKKYLQVVSSYSPSKGVAIPQQATL